MPENEKRPALSRVKNSKELDRWYWLKEELVAFARKKKISTSGQKPVLQKRIGVWLDTGVAPEPAKKPRAQSKFDWGSATLTPRTVITDSYRNSQNVRAFMKKHAGEHFRFSNEFMNWMRAHVGSTLAEAVEFWQDLDARKKKGYQEASLPQNQYAQFSRALAKASPGISAKDIRRIWKKKRSGPGPHVFKAGDEKL